MDITVYLPDELGLWAKSAGLNLSRMLRDATEEIKMQTEAAAEALEGATEVKLALEDNDGRSYTGRFVGAQIADGRDREVYLTDDHRVLVYDRSNRNVSEIEGEGEELGEVLRNLLDADAYAEACEALGIEQIVDL